MSIYAYAVVDSAATINSLTGLDRIPVKNIPYRDIGVVVSELPEQSDLSDPAAELALAHAAVTDQLMAGFTVLPVRFGTVFQNQDAVIAMAEEHYADLRLNFTRLAGTVEFGLRVIWPGEAIRNQFTTEKIGTLPFSPRKPVVSLFSDRRRPGAAGGKSSAISRMREKLAEYRRDRAFEERADQDIAAIDGILGKLALEKRYERLRTVNLLLNGYYLVRKGRQGKFRAAFGQLKLVRPDLKYLLSGPWPPYNFVMMSHEKLQAASRRQVVPEAGSLGLGALSDE
jgi:hypothetical protein